MGTEDPYIGRKYSVARMKLYDSMPPKVRQEWRQSLNDKPYENFEKAVRYVAKKFYGMDHPQAQGEFCWPLKP